MNYAIHRISLDVNNDAPSQLVLSAKRGDSAKLLIISLLADKHNYIINEGCYATLTGKKRDGAVFEHECAIDLKNNKIEYPFQPFTVSKSGVVDCEVNIFNTHGERLTTSRFTIIVYETIFTDAIADAEDDITAVTQLRADLNELIQTTEKKLENGEFDGDSVFIRYSANADGTDFTEEWAKGQDYIGIANGLTAPTDKSGYRWLPFQHASNLENGTGDYSVVQKTAEREENEATAEGTYAGGKKSKSTTKRGFTHGNTVENNGNSAASFGQVYTNDGNCALTEMVGGYNGGASAAVVGQNIYNKKNQTANVPTDEGGAASAMVGAYLYNRGSHAQIMGYFLKNRKPLKTVLGRANADIMTNLFEIGAGKEITTVASDNSSFTYNGYTYTVNYDENNKIVSISFPPNAPSYPKTIPYYDEQGHTDFRVETEGGVEVCLALVNGVLKVYEPYNIFEIDELGQVIAKGGLFVKKAGSLAELELQHDGLRVQGKGQFDGNVSGYNGKFTDGIEVTKTGYGAKFVVHEDGASLQGVLSVSNPPQKATDAVRKEDLEKAVKTYYQHNIEIETQDGSIIRFPPYVSSFSEEYDNSILEKLNNSYGTCTSNVNGLLGEGYGFYNRTMNIFFAQLYTGGGVAGKNIDVGKVTLTDTVEPL